MLVNRRNSLTIDASNFSGLQIDVQNLRGISLSKEKETVRLQAGVSNGEVSKALFDQGYITSKHALFPISPALTTHILLQPQALARASL